MGEGEDIFFVFVCRRGGRVRIQYSVDECLDLCMRVLRGGSNV